MSEPEQRFGRFKQFMRESGLDPSVAVVLGSGLGEVVAPLNVVARASQDSVLGIDAPQVAGHARQLVVGTLDDVPMVAFLGRYHLYQGLQMAEIVAPIRALAAVDISCVILTNAAGGINASYQPGDLMVVSDHLNLPGLAGISPLIPPLDPGAVDFVSMRDAYNLRLRDLLRSAAHDLNFHMHEGVYGMVAGPTYETASELRMLRGMGVDAVGMSTVPEVIMARALGMEVAVISTITNRAVPEDDETPDHDEVLRMGRSSAAKLALLLTRVLPNVVG